MLVSIDISLIRNTIRPNCDLWQVMSHWSAEWHRGHVPKQFLILLASGVCYRQKDEAYANEATIRKAMTILSILNPQLWCIGAIARFDWWFSFAPFSFANWMMWRICRLGFFTFEAISTESAIQLATIIARCVIAICSPNLFKIFARLLLFA